MGKNKDSKTPKAKTSGERNFTPKAGPNSARQVSCDTKITNPTRIAGIRLALRKKAIFALTDKSTKLIAHLDVACGITNGSELLALTEKEHAAVAKAFTFAFEAIPDAARIEGDFPGAKLLSDIKKSNRKQKQYSRRGPQVIPARRVVEASPAVTSQVERILNETAVDNETIQAVAEIKSTENVVRTLPPKRDLSGFTTVSSASRRTKVNA